MSKHAQYLKMLITGIRLDNNFSNAYMRHKKYCVGVTMINELSISFILFIIPQLIHTCQLTILYILL